MLFENYARGGSCLYDREPGNERLALYLSVRAQEEVGREGLRKVSDLAEHLDEAPLALGTIDLIPKVKAAGAAMRALDLPQSHVAVQGLVGWAGTERSLFLEAFHKEASKESAFRAYCGARGCEASRAAAIGDGRNDLGLFGVVGLSIAMGNAPDLVKEAATHVAPPYDENGLATAIREHLLP
jgi:hydroxymethylpyrimidine pyrophosphatase-like HAD family hydrolase